MRQLSILIFISTGLFGQNNTDKNYSFLADTAWTKQNLINCKAEFISIKDSFLVPCGFISDWTTGQFKILTVDNKNIKVGKVYTFYIPCSAGINDINFAKGKTYSLTGLIKFPDNDSALNHLNGFKKGHSDWLWLRKIK